MKKLTRRPVHFKGNTVGLDVHKAFIQYAVLDKQGDEREGGRIPGTPSGLAKLVDRLESNPCQFVLEAGGSFIWVYDLLADRVGRDQVHVAQPHRVRPIANSLEKNDANDAWWLAYLCFEGRLPEAYVAEGDIREIRIATREYMRAVQRRGDLIRRFRSHLALVGLASPGSNFHTVTTRAKARERIAQALGVRQVALARLLQSIEQLDEDVEGWQEQMDTICEGLPDVEQMAKRIAGMGPITSAVVYGEMGDPRRFKSAKAFAKATGLAPGFRESGGHRTPMGMSRAGSARARWALTRAVIACMRCKSGPGVHVKYWVLTRSRTKPKKKVIVAAARKLAEAVWRLFNLGEEFDLAKAFPISKAMTAA